MVKRVSCAADSVLTGRGLSFLDHTMRTNLFKGAQVCSSVAWRWKNHTIVIKQLPTMFYVCISFSRFSFFSYCIFFPLGQNWRKRMKICFDPRGNSSSSKAAEKWTFTAEVFKHDRGSFHQCGSLAEEYFHWSEICPKFDWICWRSRY